MIEKKHTFLGKTCKMCGDNCFYDLVTLNFIELAIRLTPFALI